MAKLFKGFKQVLSTTFAGTTDEEKVGYIWFVRTPAKGVDAAGNPIEGEDNELLNDSYDIYFGTKHYGHFMEGEIPALATALGKIKDAIGLGNEYNFLCMPKELEDALKADKKGQEDEGVVSVSHAIEYIYNNFVKTADFETYTATNDAKVNSKAGYAELSEDGKTISFFKDSTAEKGDALFTIDSSAFVKDGMLDDVEVTTPALLKRDITYNSAVYHQATEGEKDTKFLHFIWKVTNYKKNKTGVKEETALKEDFVLLSEIATAYSADGTSIEMSQGNVFSVKRVGTDKTEIQSDITIEGGPLASDDVKAAFPNGVIPHDMPLQSVLMKLLCVEKWPSNPKSTAGSLSSSIEKPTISFSPSGLVEVGQEINVTVKNGASSHSVTSPKASGFTYGYSAADDNTRDSENEYIYATKTEDKVLSGETTLTVSGKIEGTQTGNENANSATVTGKFNAVEGSANTVTAKNTSATYSVTFADLPIYYGCSNLKNTHTEDGTTKATAEIKGKTFTTDVKTSGNASGSVTGVYPIFVNGVKATGNATDDKKMEDLVAPTETKMPLMKKNQEKFAVSFAAHDKAAGIGYTLWLPKGRTIKSAIGINGLTGQYDLANNASEYVKIKTVQKEVQGNQVDYDEYSYISTQGANRVKFELN